MSETAPPALADNLHPCPFCNSAPGLVEGLPKLGGLRKGLSVRCSNDRCVSSKANLGVDIFSHAPEAIEAWNHLAEKLRPTK